MSKRKRRIPLPVKIILGVLILLILTGGGFMVKQLYEQSKMSPLPTGEVAPGVYAVNNEFVNFYLIKGDGGYLMVDAGNSETQTAAALPRLGISPEEVFAVLLTHSDGDHVSALSLFPNAEVYLPAREVQMVNGATSRSPLGGNKLTAAYDTLEDGETLGLMGLSVECILTPGHTPGSMCFLVNGKYLFTGDTMSLKGGKAGLFNSFYNMDDETQRQSLQKLSGTTAPEYIFTAHYGYTDDSAAAFAAWVQ